MTSSLRHRHHVVPSAPTHRKSQAGAWSPGSKGSFSEAVAPCRERTGAEGLAWSRWPEKLQEGAHRHEGCDGVVAFTGQSSGSAAQSLPHQRVGKMSTRWELGSDPAAAAVRLCHRKIASSLPHAKKTAQVLRAWRVGSVTRRTGRGAPWMVKLQEGERRAQPAASQPPSSFLPLPDLSNLPAKWGAQRGEHGDLPPVGTWAGSLKQMGSPSPRITDEEC